MRIQSAFLANHATVSEGMLYVLGGGASYLRRDAFPAHVGLYLCGFVDFVDLIPVEPGALTMEMTVTVHPVDQDLILGTQDLNFTWLSDHGSAANTYGQIVPFTIDIRPVVLPNAGHFEVDLELVAETKRVRATVGFEAVKVDPKELTYHGDYEKPAP